MKRHKKRKSACEVVNERAESGFVEKLGNGSNKRCLEETDLVLEMENQDCDSMEVNNQLIVNDGVHDISSCGPFVYSPLTFETDQIVSDGAYDITSSVRGTLVESPLMFESVHKVEMLSSIGVLGRTISKNRGENLLDLLAKMKKLNEEAYYFKESYPRSAPEIELALEKLNKFGAEFITANKAIVQLLPTVNRKRRW